MTRTYDENGMRPLPTGGERRMPDGRTIQMHDRENPEWARELLAKLEGVPGRGNAS